MTLSKEQMEKLMASLKADLEHRKSRIPERKRKGVYDDTAARIEQGQTNVVLTNKKLRPDLVLMRQDPEKVVTGECNKGRRIAHTPWSNQGESGEKTGNKK